MEHLLALRHTPGEVVKAGIVHGDPYLKHLMIIFGDQGRALLIDLDNARPE